MAFFKVGDRVTVRSDLKDRSTHYFMENDDANTGYMANRWMCQCAGETLTIAQAYDRRLYRVKETDLTDGNWAWTDEMFDEYLHRFDGEAFETASQAELTALLGGN